MLNNGDQWIERVIPDRDICPGCGYRARILRQRAQLPPAGLIARVVGKVESGAVVENTAIVMEVLALCMNCLLRERWGWKGETWMKLEELRVTQDPSLVSRYGP